MTSHAVYVYCVVRARRRPSTSRVPPGLPGGAPPVPVSVDGGLWLIGASVPLDRYGPDALERGLRDLNWVGDVAMAHEAVVRHFAQMRGTVVIPMKLFTMFSSEARAVREMRARRPELTRLVARIEGCEEWGVRVVRAAAAVRRPAGAARSGSAFLAARKAARDASREEARAAADAADRAFASLSEIARDARRRTDDGPGGPAALMEAAFLVPARRRARFQQAAGRLSSALARSGGRMTLSGPWPPYSFVAAGDES